MSAEFAKFFSGTISETSGDTLLRSDLATWLSDVRLAESTLNFPQTEGFLFAVACCPADIAEKDWLAIVLGDVFESSGDCAYRALSKQLPAICTTLQKVFHGIESDVLRLTYRIPANYPFSWDALERSSMEQWCEGMLLADEWLASWWMRGLGKIQRTDPYACARLSEELDETVNLIKLLADVDSALECFVTKPEESMLDIRQRVKDAYDALDQYLIRYMQAGKVLAEYCKKREPMVRGEPKVGRNDLCVCGSGLKYKKCCMGL